MGTAVEVAQIAAFVLCVAFPIQYAIRMPRWRTTPEGWYLMLSHLGVSLILALGVVGIFGGTGWMQWAGRPFVRLGVYVTLSLIFCTSSGLLIHRLRGRSR